MTLNLYVENNGGSLRISVIGAGYVGLVTAACFAPFGHEVICADIDAEKVRKINQGQSPIYERGLEELIKKFVGRKLRATTDNRRAVKESDVCFIAVSTPSKENGSLDTKNVEACCRDIALALKEKRDYFVVVMKSTVLPGTAEAMGELIERISGKKAGVDFGLAVNPEFLKEGVAVQDVMEPDRIVMGANDRKSMRLLEEAYRPFKSEKIRTDIRTAEMIKYASNAFLASKISLINEIGNLCKTLGIDTYEVARGVGLDSRIGPKFLSAGIGFGGSCFPKDVSALISLARKTGYRSMILESVMEVNRKQPLRAIEIARRWGGLKGRTIAVLGLSYKPNTDDMRDSPAITIVNALLREGARVRVYDPQAMENARRIFGGAVQYCKNAKEALRGAGVCVIATDWDEFKNKKLYKGVRVIDGRNTVKLPREYERVC